MSKGSYATLPVGPVGMDGRLFILRPRRSRCHLVLDHLNRHGCCDSVLLDEIIGRVWFSLSTDWDISGRVSLYHLVNRYVGYFGCGCPLLLLRELGRILVHLRSCLLHRLVNHSALADGRCLSDPLGLPAEHWIVYALAPPDWAPLLCWPSATWAKLGS